MNELNKHYKKPPIMEAVLDMVVLLPEKKDQLIEVAKLKNFLKKPFSNPPEEIHEDTIQFRNSRDGTQVGSHRQKTGYKFVSEDKKYILQIRKNRFTFSQLNSYEDWKKFSGEARVLWDIFCKELGPQKVERVALRYINKINIPELKFELEDYFKTYPKVMDGEAGMNNFFLQVHLPQKEGGMAILNQRITDPSEIGYTSIIFDIDVFDFMSFNPTDNELWKRINILRDQKNKLFDNSITDKTKRLFL